MIIENLAMNFYCHLVVSAWRGIIQNFCIWFSVAQIIVGCIGYGYRGCGVLKINGWKLKGENCKSEF